MFSPEFMNFLINYQPDGVEEPKKETVKEIEFKNCYSAKLAKVYITANK